MADAAIHRLFNAVPLCNIAMSMILTSVLAASLAFGPALPPGFERVQHRRDQEAAMAARRDGRLLSLREIENRVVPQMRGAQYIGFDFDSASAVYTLKFLRDGSVIWVTVDGRSGAVIGRAGG